MIWKKSRNPRPFHSSERLCEQKQPHRHGQAAGCAYLLQFGFHAFSAVARTSFGLFGDFFLKFFRQGGAAVIDQTAHLEAAVLISLEANADNIVTVVRTGVAGEIATARLGVPALAGHLSPANRAEILLAAHVAHGGGFVLIIVEDPTADAARDLCPVKAVFMLSQGTVIFRDTLF